MKENYKLLEWLASGKTVEEFFLAHFPSIYPPTHPNFKWTIRPVNQPELAICYDNDGPPIGVKPRNEMEGRDG